MMYKLIRKYSPDDINGLKGRPFTDLYYGKTLLKKLQSALSESQKILIYGDYDADGIMATYILYAGLSRISPGNINWFINNRFDDGYNITLDSMKKCLGQFPDTQLLITCDNGINAVEAVDHAMERGITVLVTDHHVQTRALRPDCPAVDEKSIKQRERDNEAGIEPEEFCGAELARRIIAELYEKLGLVGKHKEFLEGLYAYSGFATITDVVPMNPSNHALGRKCLQILQKDEGFWRLLKEEVFADDLKRKIKKEIHHDTIGYYYGPLVNAGGRMTGEAKPAMRILLSYDSGDESLCREAIRDLVRLNETRKELSEHDDQLAFSIIEKNGYADDNFILLCSEEFSEGVNGLTAGHISEKYNVPCAVLSPDKKDPKAFKGSARSVGGCDLIKLLTSHGDLIRAGGHAMAAGLSIDKDDLEKVRALLLEDLKDFVSPPDPEPDLSYQAKDITMGIVKQHKEMMEELEPFGPGFEEPRIEFRCETHSIWAKKKKNSEELVHATFPLDKSADNYFINANWWKHLEDAKKWYDNAQIVRRDRDRRGYPREWREFRCLGKAERNEYTKNGMDYVSIQITIDKMWAVYAPSE